MRRAFSVLLFASLLACSDPVQPVMDDVQRFAAQQLPMAQQVVVIFNDPWSNLLVFKVKYGSGQDCPSGCFYEEAYGLRRGQRMGWINGLGKRPYEQPVGLASFDVTSADAVLFREATFERFESLPIYQQGFLPMLARDFDTPHAALLRIAQSLGRSFNPAVGHLLLDRLEVERYRDVLQVLADLPIQSGYQDVRDRARRILAGLDG